MKNLVIIGIAILFLFGFSNVLVANGQQEPQTAERQPGELSRGAAVGAARGYGRVAGRGNFGADAQPARPNDPSTFTTLFKGTLGTEHIATLLYIWEEEKLARDVYSALGDFYGLPLFSNIARSEQNHMDQLKALLERYGLRTPAELPPGMFQNAELSNLYNQLTEKGKQSLHQAFEVGITIELMDIEDLEHAIDSIPAEDVQFVLGQLLMGSHNHLAAFQRQAQR